MEDRTYTIAGWSVRNGELKLRFTNDTNRTRVLERRGHKDIKLFELPSPMAREDAARWLGRQKDATADVKGLVSAVLGEAKAEEKPRTAPAPAPKKVKASAARTAPASKRGEASGRRKRKAA